VAPIAGDAQRETFDLMDTSALKRALDDAAVGAVLDAGMQELYTVSNLKIGFGLFTCLWAVLAQFFPKKHPHHWHVLVASLVIYAICTLVLNLLLWRMEGDAFLFAVSVSNSGQRRGTIVTLSSIMPKYQEQYSLIFRHRDGLLDLPREVSKLEDSITEWFDSDGCMLKTKFQQRVKQVLQTPGGITSPQIKNQR